MRILLFRSKISRMFLWEFYLKSIYRSLTILIFHLKTQLRNKSIQINDQSTTSIIIYNLELILLNNLYIRGQFHQRFTSSFCACRSRKRKKFDCLFALLGSAPIKAAGRKLMKLSPAVLISSILTGVHFQFSYWGTGVHFQFYYRGSFLVFFSVVHFQYSYRGSLLVFLQGFISSILTGVHFQYS